MVWHPPSREKPWRADEHGAPRLAGGAGGCLWQAFTLPRRISRTGGKHACVVALMSCKQGQGHGVSKSVNGGHAKPCAHRSRCGLPLATVRTSKSILSAVNVDACKQATEFSDERASKLLHAWKGT